MIALDFETTIDKKLYDYLLSIGWKDTTYRNDICPSMGNIDYYNGEDSGIVLWIMQDEEKNREEKEVTKYRLGTLEKIFIESDNPNDIINYFKDKTMSNQGFLKANIDNIERDENCIMYCEFNFDINITDSIYNISGEYYDRTGPHINSISRIK